MWVPLSRDFSKIARKFKLQKGHKWREVFIKWLTEHGLNPTVPYGGRNKAEEQGMTITEVPDGFVISQAYFDNGYGFYFNWDGFVSKDADGEMTIQGYTEHEIESLKTTLTNRLEQYISKLNPKVNVDAIITYFMTGESEEEGTEEIAEDLRQDEGVWKTISELMYMDAYLDIINGWTYSFDDLRAMANETGKPTEISPPKVDKIQSTTIWDEKDNSSNTSFPMQEQEPNVITGKSYREMKERYWELLMKYVKQGRWTDEERKEVDELGSILSDYDWSAKEETQILVCPNCGQKSKPSIDRTSANEIIFDSLTGDYICGNCGYQGKATQMYDPKYLKEEKQMCEECATDIIQYAFELSDEDLTSAEEEIERIKKGEETWTKCVRQQKDSGKSPKHARAYCGYIRSRLGRHRRRREEEIGEKCPICGITMHSSQGHWNADHYYAYTWEEFQEQMTHSVDNLKDLREEDLLKHKTCPDCGERMELCPDHLLHHHNRTFMDEHKRWDYILNHTELSPELDRFAQAHGTLFPCPKDIISYHPDQQIGLDIPIPETSLEEVQSPLAPYNRCEYCGQLIDPVEEYHTHKGQQYHGQKNEEQKQPEIQYTPHRAICKRCGNQFVSYGDDECWDCRAAQKNVPGYESISEFDKPSDPNQPPSSDIRVWNYAASNFIKPKEILKSKQLIKQNKTMNIEDEILNLLTATQIQLNSFRGNVQSINLISSNIRELEKMVGQLALKAVESVPEPLVSPVNSLFPPNHGSPITNYPTTEKEYTPVEVTVATLGKDFESSDFKLNWFNNALAKLDEIRTAMDSWLTDVHYNNQEVVKEWKSQNLGDKRDQYKV